MQPTVSFPLQLMEAFLNGQDLAIVVLHVELDFDIAQENAITLLRNMVARTVKEIYARLKTVTLSIVKVIIILIKVFHETVMFHHRKSNS